MRVKELLEGIRGELEALEVAKLSQEALEKGCIERHGLYHLQLKACREREDELVEKNGRAGAPADFGELKTRYLTIFEAALQEYLELQPESAFKAFVFLIKATSLQDALVDATCRIVTSSFDQLLKRAELRKQAAVQGTDSNSSMAQQDVDHLAVVAKEEIEALLDDDLAKCPSLSCIKHLYAIAAAEGSPLVGSTISRVVQDDRADAGGTAGAVWHAFRLASLVFWRKRCSGPAAFQSSIRLWDDYLSDGPIKLRGSSRAFEQDYLDNDMRRRQQAVQLKEVYQSQALAWPPAITDALEKLWAELEK